MELLKVEFGLPCPHQHHPTPDAGAPGSLCWPTAWCWRRVLRFPFWSLYLSHLDLTSVLSLRSAGYIHTAEDRQSRARKVLLPSLWKRRFQQPSHHSTGPPPEARRSLEHHSTCHSGDLPCTPRLNHIREEPARRGGIPQSRIWLALPTPAPPTPRCWST